MGTTKLTRKEIAADPIHDALIGTLETLRARAKIISLAAVGAVILGIGIYFFMGYLDARNTRAQQELGKGMDLYHGLIDASAAEDPFAVGPTPVFRSEEAKYRAAAAVFSPLVSQYGSSKPGVIARYYLGLCQQHLGQAKESAATLEAVANNTADRTVAYLAKKVLANQRVAAGEAKKGQEILQGMLKDPQCDLPREDIQIDLARAYLAQGMRAEAIKILQEAQEAGSGGMLQSLIFQELSRLQSGPGNAPLP